MARLLRIPETQGVGIYVTLTAWALEMAPDGDLSGQLEDQDPAVLVAAAVGWEGDPGALLAAMERTKIVMRDASGTHAVAGLDVYSRALTSSEGRKVAASVAARARWDRNNDASRMPDASPSHATAMRPDAKTQTQTQTQKVEDLPPPSSAGPREDLKLESQNAPRQKRTPKPKPEKPTDPRHAPLTQELASAGWPHHGGRTARAIADLLELAGQAGHRGDAGYHEVARRAAIARGHEGFPRVRELHELVAHWGHFAEVPRRAGQGPPDGLSPPASGNECVACGASGEGASVGEPEVFLGYSCGCVAQFNREMNAGMKFTEAREWAEQRRKDAA
jgi:hypothetical protein